MLKKYLSETSAHGIGPLIKARSSIIRVVWALCLLGTLAVWLFHTSTLLIQFISEPTTVSIIPAGNEFIPPDIFFCNQITLSGSFIEHPSVQAHPDFVKIQYHMSNISSMFDSQQSRHEAFWQTIPNYLVRNVLAHRLEQSRVIFVDGVSSNPINEKLDIVPHWKHFECYRYKSDTQYFNSLLRYVTAYLYTDANMFKTSNITFNGEALADLTFSESTMSDKDSGYKVYFVAPGQYPHSDATSILASSGFKTSTHVRMERRDLLNTERFPCSNKETNVTYVNPLVQNGTISFISTAMDCVYKKFHEEAMDVCGCTTHDYPLTKEQMDKSFEFCHDLNIIGPRFLYNKDAINQYVRLKQVCLQNIESKLKQFNQKCLPETHCGENTYEATWEINKWPLLSRTEQIRTTLLQPMYMLKLMSFPGLILPGIQATLIKMQNTDTQSQIMVSENFVKIDLRPAEMYSMSLKESFTYELRNLASDTGGILGFYLGVSVLTLCEILAFFAELINSCFAGACSKRKSND